MKFKLEGAFKRSITLNFTKDEGIEDEYMEHGKKYEFGDIGWYPSAYTAVYRYDHRVPLTTSGDAVNDFLGFQSQSVLVSSATRAIGIIFLISPPKCFRQLLYIPIYFNMYNCECRGDVCLGLVTMKADLFLIDIIDRTIY